jgi:glycosyltransferase involved in cell wall biosynthesis
MSVPFVSVCTPTFNRRPFIPMIIKCFLQQDYPLDRVEWIIIDDGTDKIGDLVDGLPQVKYFSYDEKMPLGKKRNLMHEKSSGDFIVYMDDDDYYPPTRISHAIDMLKKNPGALCAGSSEMYIYFKHIRKMYQFGPYGPNHSTAASFAFRRELLTITSYDDNECIAEEKKFLRNYTIPFVQLNPLNSILVFSHIHNSYDKKTMLDTMNKYIKPSQKVVEDFVKDEEIKQFFLKDIDGALNDYEPGNPIHKQDVKKHMDELIEMRKNRINTMNMNAIESQTIEQKLYDQTMVVQGLTTENGMLKEKVRYLDSKIKLLIEETIQLRKKCQMMETIFSKST